jgi:hypothetical protein
VEIVFNYFFILISEFIASIDFRVQIFGELLKYTAVVIKFSHKWRKMLLIL